MTFDASRLLLPLPRPQYVPVPEALISALAWRVFDVEVESLDPSRATGLIFQTNKNGTKTMVIRSTSPTGPVLARFREALEVEGLRITGDPENLSGAILNSIGGVRIARSGSRPASPLSPALALLQNTRGLLGTKNPPDLAEILESLFTMGLPHGSKSPGASELWLRAAEHRLEIDPLIASLDRAVDSSVLGSSRKLRSTAQAPKAESWMGLHKATPFAWFAQAWTRLTEPQWVEALPARVWVDWATTVLRLAVGAGYLREAAWYESVARSLLKSDAPTWGDFEANMAQVLPWKSSRAGIHAIDLAPLMSWRVFRGDQIRVLISSWLKENDCGSADLLKAVARMHQDSALKAALVDALGSRVSTGGGKNLWEAVKYALKTRDAGGQSADYYGFLQSNGRYLTANPGTEWIAVIASLSCGAPGGTTNVGRVMAALDQIGIRPELSDLVSLLERAGMARGSADADQGVIVQSAF